MKTPHLCFILDCKNTINRESDDFDNLYCDEHSEFDNTDLLEWISQDEN